MAYFNTKQTKYIPQPIPPTPPYVPPAPPVPPESEEGSTPNIPRPVFSGEYNIDIGITNDENIKVHKSYANVFSGSISIKDSVDIYNPIIYINTTNDLSKCNYMNIFNKYYFINSIRMLPGNLWEIIAHVDVLMTYSNELMSHRAIVARSSNIYNKYLEDKSFKTYAYKNTRTLKFPSGFSKTLQWVLVTLGGGNDD